MVTHGPGPAAKTPRAVATPLHLCAASQPAYSNRHCSACHPKSCEPNKGSAQGADFSILTAIAHNHPHAHTLRDLGVTETSSSDMTQAMLSLLNQYRAGTPFQAQDVEDASFQLQPCSEQSPVLLHTIVEQEGTSTDGLMDLT